MRGAGVAVGEGGLVLRRLALLQRRLALLQRRLALLQRRLALLQRRLALLQRRKCSLLLVSEDGLPNAEEVHRLRDSEEGRDDDHPAGAALEEGARPLVTQDTTVEGGVSQLGYLP